MRHRAVVCGEGSVFCYHHAEWLRHIQRDQRQWVLALGPAWTTAPPALPAPSTPSSTAEIESCTAQNDLKLALDFGKGLDVNSVRKTNISKPVLSESSCCCSSSMQSPVQWSSRGTWVPDQAELKLSVFSLIAQGWGICIHHFGTFNVVDVNHFSSVTLWKWMEPL